MISFEDFKKLDLRVARILTAERIPDSEKLVKLEIDIGEEKRQIVTGIGKHYNPETLAGREIVIIANLEPRVLKGVESQGMLLAANSGNEPILITPCKEVPPGSVVR